MMAGLGGVPALHPARGRASGRARRTPTAPAPSGSRSAGCRSWCGRWPGCARASRSSCRHPSSDFRSAAASAPSCCSTAWPLRSSRGWRACRRLCSPASRSASSSRRPSSAPTSPTWPQRCMLPLVLVALLTQRQPAVAGVRHRGLLVPGAAGGATDPRCAAPAARRAPGPGCPGRRRCRRWPSGAPLAPGRGRAPGSPPWSLIYGMVGLSVVVLSGWAGQISLGQFGFAGIGAAGRRRHGDPDAGRLLRHPGRGCLGRCGRGAADRAACPARARHVPRRGHPRLRGLRAVPRPEPRRVGLAAPARRSTRSVAPCSTAPSTPPARRPTTGCASYCSWSSPRPATAGAHPVRPAVRRHPRQPSGRPVLRREHDASQARGVRGVRCGRALGGALLAFQQQAVDQETYGLTVSIDVFVFTIVGGLTTPAGALLGRPHFEGIRLLGPALGIPHLEVLATGVGRARAAAACCPVAWRRRCSASATVAAPDLRHASRSPLRAWCAQAAPGRPRCVRGVGSPADALLSVEGSRSATTACRCSSASTSSSAAARWWRCSAPTAPASPRCCAPSPGCPAARPGERRLRRRRTSPASTPQRHRPRRHRPGARRPGRVPDRLPSTSTSTSAALGRWTASAATQAARRGAAAVPAARRARRPARPATCPAVSSRARAGHGLRDAPAAAAHRRAVARARAEGRRRPDRDASGEIHAAGTSIVLVEQSVNVALTLADRAYFLEKGAGPLRRPDPRPARTGPTCCASVFLPGGDRPA